MKQNLLRRYFATLMLFTVSTLSWAYDFVVDGIYYNKNSNGSSVTVTYKTTSYNSYSGSVAIPSKVAYNNKTYDVTSIGDWAFNKCSGLTSVTIGNSVTSIGHSAFSGCSGLTSVTIGNSVTSIGAWAFYNCSGLTSITIPNSVTSIGNVAFSGCSGLTSVTIPNSVTSIGEYVFSGCSGLTSVTIPNSVTSIGGYVFSGCSGLTSVTIPNSVTSIGEYVFSDCSGLTSVTIGNSVTSIGDWAFYNCTGLTSVTIPNSVTSIGQSAFYDCSGLTKAEFASIESLCKIKFGTYYSNPLYYAHHLYIDGQEVTDVVIPNSVTSIGESAFAYCSGLTSVIIPNSVTSIGEGAFYGCSGLTSVTIPNSVTSIGEGAFSYCSGLTSVTIPNSVTSIGNYTFYGCSGLTSVTIPNSVTSIGQSAFYDCSGLTSMTIPNSVTSIGNYAFFNCSGLTSITIPNSVTSIGYAAFAYCSGLTSVTIGNSVTSIGDYSFQGCTGLTSITIPESVISIGSQAFFSCTALTSVTIPNSVTSIGNYTFYGCSGLTSVTIPNSVTSIGDKAFSGCSGLEEVILNSNSIVSKTYTSTSNISTIFGSQVKKYIFGDNITGIGEYAFPSNTSIYVSAKSSLLAAWNYGISPYDLETSVLLANPLPTVQTNTASSIHVSRNSSAEESGIISSESITAAGVTITKIGHTTKFTGLTPNTAYTVAYNSTIKYAGSTFSYSNEYRATTNALTLTTSQPKVISAGNAVVGAVSNLDDAEENAGFEWRRTDWTDEFTSNTGVAYLYEGTMEGYIRNLYTEKLWKVRPYYQDNSGIYYYGEWVGLDPTNTSYYEPTVHTYARIDQTEDKIQISGYVQRGTDAVSKQGFKYWVQEDNARGAGISIPSGAKTVEAEGRVMEVELTGLLPNTTYAYVAFVTTTEGETFYGKQLSFTTGDDPEASITGDANGNGEVEIGDVTSVLTLMATPEAIGYDKKAADANGNGEIEIGDVTTILTIMANGGYPEEWNLTVRDQDNNYVVPAEGGTKTVVLTTTRDVELSCSESWAHLGTMSYNVLENGKIYELYPEITFDANTTGEVRAATIYFDNGTDNRLSLIYTQERVRYDVVPPTWKGFDYKVKKGGVGQETERGEICPGDKVRVYCYRKSNGVLTGMVKGTITLKWTTQASGPSVVTEMTEKVITPVNPTYDGWLLYSYADFDIPEGGPYDFRKAEVTCNLNFECFGNAVRWEDHTSHMDPYIGSIYTTNCNATKGSACTTENVLLWKSN